MKKSVAAQCWYNQIEPGIRNEVKLLRDNGFNTYSSCEHRMEVAIDSADVEQLSGLLLASGYRDFVIMRRHEARDGHIRECAVLEFGDDEARSLIRRKYRSLVSWWWEP